MRNHVILRGEGEAQQLGQDYLVGVVRGVQTEPIDALALNGREPACSWSSQFPCLWFYKRRSRWPLVVVLGAEPHVVIVFDAASSDAFHFRDGIHKLLFHQPESELNCSVTAEPVQVLPELFGSDLGIDLHWHG